MKHGSEEESFACHLFKTSVLISVHPWLSFCRDAQERRDNAGTGDKCPAQCAGDFRFPTRASTMVYWNFEDSQPAARGFHLHFEIPAVGLLAHIELFKGVAPDRTKRAHVGITNSVEEPQDPPDEESDCG